MLRLKRKNVSWSQIMEGRNLAFLMVLPLDPMMKLLLLTVIMFDKDLKLIRTFGQGSGDNKLNYPTSVAIGHNVIVVSKFHAHVVKKFSLQGDCLSQFGFRGSGDGEFYRPQGLCFNSKGLLYVVDHGNCRVQVFRENVFQFQFGSEGRNPGQFKEPRYIAVDSSDQLYVTDQCTDSGISVFTEDGCFIKRINYSKFALLQTII